MFQTTVSGLRSRLYRLPETDDERYQEDSQELALQQEWNREEADERLKKAYEESGIIVWAQTALRELEAETRVERNRRNREQEAGKNVPSLSSVSTFSFLHKSRRSSSSLVAP
jgi:hypothetical protein